MNDTKEITGVEYNFRYTLDTFEQKFNDAQSEKEKQEVFNKLLDSDIDFTIPENKERMVEYHAQLNDYREELKIQDDYLINLELEMFPGKWQLYTCIKDVNICTTGSNYYVKIDDLAKQYQDTDGDVPEAIAEYVSKIKPLIWVVTDNGIGTLKSKNLFIEDVYGKFDEHFTKYENNVKLCECYKLNELKDKYPNDMDFAREARKLTIDGRLGKLISDTPNDLELGKKLREEKF